MSSTNSPRQVIEKEDTVYKKNDKVKFEVWYHSDDLSRTNYRRVDFSKVSEKDFYRKINKLLGSI